MVFHRKTGPMPPEPQTMPARREDRPQPRMVAPPQGTTSGVLDQSLIGSDLNIEGHGIVIRCKGTLRVNGQIQADVHSRQLEVGSDAIVTGSITAESVEVRGRVNGAILSNKVILHATAEVEGDIATQYLSIEQGASFDGRSRRVRDPAEIVPQLETTNRALESPETVRSPVNIGSPATGFIASSGSVADANPYIPAARDFYPAGSESS